MSKYFMALLMKELGEELDRIEEQGLSEEDRDGRRKRSILLTSKVNGASDNPNSIMPINLPQPSSGIEMGIISPDKRASLENSCKAVVGKKLSGFGPMPGKRVSKIQLEVGYFAN